MFSLSLPNIKLGGLEGINPHKESQILLVQLQCEIASVSLQLPWSEGLREELRTSACLRPICEA